MRLWKKEKLKSLVAVRTRSVPYVGYQTLIAPLEKVGWLGGHGLDKAIKMGREREYE